NKLTSNLVSFLWLIYNFIVFGYSTSVKYSACAGTEKPALLLLLDVIISCNSSIFNLPTPILIMVPTMALTIFRKNLSAFITKCSSSSFKNHSAFIISQLYVFTFVLLFEK